MNQRKIKDPPTSDLADALESVQRRAARWVCNRYRRTSSVDDMLEELQWPTLAARRTEARLINFYKFHHSLININSKFAPQPSKARKSRRLYHQLSYDVPSCRTDYRKKSFFPRTIPQWNSLPSSAVSASTVDAFKTCIK